MNNLELIEKNFFPVIKKVLKSFEKTDYEFITGDSTSIRAYTPFSRDIEDLDLIFKTETNISELQKFIMISFPESSQEELISVNDINISGYFLRTKFPIDIIYHLEKKFCIDFHIGGSIYKNKMLYITNDRFFESKEMKPIKSIGNLENLNIPVPKLEKLLHFKLFKYLGKDYLDVISLILSNKINIEFLSNEINKDEVQQLLININDISDNLTYKLASWEGWHFCKIGNENSTLLKLNLKNIKNMLNEFNK